MLLFIVEDVFATSLGLILTPGVGKHPVRVGTPIRLVRPDGTILQTKICGIVFSERRDISIGKELCKEDVPVGTEVWTEE